MKKKVDTITLEFNTYSANVAHIIHYTMKNHANTTK